MSKLNKALFIIVAVLALLMGGFWHASRIESVTNIDSLLHARLLHYNPVTENSPSTEKVIINQLGELTLINFWATWCPPCRKEMPVFEMIYQQHKQNDFNIIGIAIDEPEKAQAMLDSMDITYLNLFAEKTGFDLLEQNGNVQKLLPYSVLVNKKGIVLEQKLGEINASLLSSWIETHLP